KEEIKSIDSDIDKLREDLDMESHLNKEQLDELYKFIQYGEFSDDNIYDVNDLYEVGLEEIKKVNEPPVHISTDIVNFFEMIDEGHNHDKVGIGDIIRIDFKPLDIDVKLTLNELNFNFEGQSIDVDVSNNVDKPL